MNAASRRFLALIDAVSLQVIHSAMDEAAGPKNERPFHSTVGP